MPLLDHFAEPLIRRRPWAGFLQAWICHVAARLNSGLLPEQLVAVPHVEDADSLEVHVCHDGESGLVMLGVVALVTPKLKEIEERTEPFLAKCMQWMQQHKGVVLVDVVTAHKGNLHHKLIEKISGQPSQAAPQHLYATSYRTASADGAPRLDVWDEPIHLRAPLPSLPLWISAEKSVAVHLEPSYQLTCNALRIRN